ncbi:MAG: CPBP family intramembrane metalloprotease [Bacteroidales bacterium]|nr:CPBP family intramembrane metalloprotease [Bacteroidales bacterium]
MVEGLGRTVSRFLLWCLFYCAVAVVGNIVGSVTNSDEAMSWTMLSGFVLMTIVYLGKHYVELSFGRIERRAASVGISVLIASAYVLVMVSVFTLIDIEHLFPKEVETLEKTGEHLFPGIAGLLYGCIFCPVLEEIGLRGILLGGLLKSQCRPWLAILITAVIFALLHGVGVHSLVSFVFALIVGWLYWRTGSIFLCMIIHVVNNSLSFIELDGQGKVVILLIFVGSMMLLALGLWWFAKKCTTETATQADGGQSRS